MSQIAEMPKKRHRGPLHQTVINMLAGLRPIPYPVPIGNFFSKQESYLTSPTPDPKEREKGFVRRECARHHTVDLTKRENELYSWQNFPFWCAASHHYVRTYCIVGKIIYRPHSSMLTVLSPLNFTWPLPGRS
jgi:hypothetical protein